MNEYIIHIPALKAKVYQTGEDKYCVELGGFYHIHAPLDKAIECAERNLKRIVEQGIERQIKSIKRKTKTNGKSI